MASYHKSRYKPYFGRLNPQSRARGVGPVDGVFTKLKTRGLIRFTVSETPTRKQLHLTLPLDYLYFDATAGQFDMFPNVEAHDANPTPGGWQFVEDPDYTGWADVMRPYGSYLVYGCHASVKMWLPWDSLKPQIYKIGMLAERDLGVGSVIHQGATVSGVNGAFDWANNGLLTNASNWSMLNQKVYRTTTAQPQTQSTFSVSSYFDAAKFWKWTREARRVDTLFRGSMSVDSTTGKLLTVSQPSSRSAFQIAWDSVAYTDGSEVPYLTNFMFEVKLTYLVKMWDPHTINNMRNRETNV